MEWCVVHLNEDVGQDELEPQGERSQSEQRNVSSKQRATTATEEEERQRRPAEKHDGGNSD